MNDHRGEHPIPATYYRFLYHPVSKGIVFSGSLGAVNGRDGYQLLYLGGGVTSKLWNSKDGPQLGKNLDLLILADVHTETVLCAEQVLSQCRVKTLVLPEQQDHRAKWYEKKYDVDEVLKIDATKEWYIRQFRLRFLCVGEQNDRKLLFYIGSERKPLEALCMMQVKPAWKTYPCSLAVDTSDLRCEMRCMLQQDVLFCKKQNQEGSVFFLDGHFLVGAARPFEYLKQAKAYLKEDWKRIRFSTVPVITEQEWQDELLTIGTRGHHRYYLGTAGTAPFILQKLAADDPNGSFYCVSDRAGLCISGSYMKK